MPYIGRSTEAFGVRSRFTYLASASDTSVSGADVNGLSLSFTDGAYVDVFLNGVRLKHGTDYVTTTANTISSLSALAANDEIEVVVFDVFSLADMVSKANGGTFEGTVTFAGDATIGDDLTFNSDSAVLSFGADSEITLTHVHNSGLTVTNTVNGTDDTPIVLQLKSEEDAIVADDVIASIEMAAGDSDGTDGATVAAGIHAIAEGTFSASANATKLVFTTGVSETAAASATAKMTLSSAGLLTIADDFMIKDGGTIGVASANDAMTISSAGIVTFKDDIIIKDAGTIGSASDTDAISISSGGVVNISATTANTSASDGALTVAGGLGVALDASIGDDLRLISDSAVLSFGADSEIQLIHVADDGLILKHIGTGDGKEPSLTFQAGDNDIAQDDVLGSIFFQAPDEGATGDAALVAAGIEAVSEGDFSATSNATSLVFKTGSSEAAVKKMSLSSAAQLSLFTSASSTEFGRLSLTDSNNLSIGCTSTDHVGLTFGSTLLPRLNESNNDGGVDIGAASFRFNDLYLAGGLRVGGTGTSNELDDYEEGTYTASAQNYSGTFSSIQYEYYTKIGQQVFYGLRISGRSNTSDTSQMSFSGFPFAVYAEHTAAVGMNDDEFGHGMINTAEVLYFYNTTGGDFQYSQFPHTSGVARVQGSYRIA